MLLQDRSHGIKARLLTVQSKRIVIHHEKQHFKEALDQASYHLNSSGMHIFYDTLKLMENRSHLLKLDEKDGVIIESYDGRFSKGYIGNYTTNGTSSSCSGFRSSHLCRHVLFYRESMNMPMFAKKKFHRIHLIEGTDGDYVEEETEIPESPTADLLDMRLQDKLPLKEKNKKIPRDCPKM